MARQLVGIGSSANDGTGDTLRDGIDKVNDNFIEIYGKIGNGTTIGTFTTTDITSTGDFTIDGSADIILDADGGDVFFKDAGTTFGSATNTSGNLIVKSGTTTALTFSGANVTAAGTIGSGAITSTGVVTGTGFTIGSAAINETELEIIEMTIHFEECRKKLNKNSKNKEIKEHYREIITECLNKIRYMFKLKSKPSDYGRSYYNNVVNFFGLFRQRKIIEKHKRTYLPVNENGRYTRKDIIHNANFLDKRYLDLDKYNQFALICKTEGYHGSDIIHFDKHGDYYLIETLKLSWGEWDSNFTISTDELFGSHQAKSTYDKFLDYLEEFKGQLN